MSSGASPATCTRRAAPSGRWRGGGPASPPRTAGAPSLDLDHVAGELHVEDAGGELLVEAHALETDRRVVSGRLGEPGLDGHGPLRVHPQPDAREESPLSGPRLEVQDVPAPSPHRLVPRERRF